MEKIDWEKLENITRRKVNAALRKKMTTDQAFDYVVKILEKSYNRVAVKYMVASRLKQIMDKNPKEFYYWNHLTLEFIKDLKYEEV